MCWLWLEHVKNTTTLHLSIYSLLPSVSSLCPPLPLCLYSSFFFFQFFIHVAFLCPFLPVWLKALLQTYFYQIPCFLTIIMFFFFSFVMLCLFSARGPCLIIASLLVITTSCHSESCCLPGALPPHQLEWPWQNNTARDSYKFNKVTPLCKGTKHNLQDASVEKLWCWHIFTL